MSAMPASSMTSSDPAAGCRSRGATGRAASAACGPGCRRRRRARARPGPTAPPRHPMAGQLEGGADGVEGEGLAGPGRADQHRHRLPVAAVIVATAASWSAPSDRPVSGSVDGSSGAAATGRVRSRAARKRASTSTSSRLVHRARLPVAGGDGDHLVGGEHPVGDPLDRLDRGAVALAGGDGLDQVGVGERRRRRRSGRCAAGRRSTPRGRRPARRARPAVLVEHDRVEPPRARRRCVPASLLGPADEPLGGVGSPAGRRRLRPSSRRRSVRARPRACAGGWPAPPPGGPRGVSGVPVAASQASISVRPLREHVEQRLGDAGDLGDVPAGPPLHPQRRGQLVAEHGLEHLPGGPGVAIQVGVYERRPPAVGAFGQVGDQDVPVQQRVTGPRGAMPERRRHHPRRRQLARPDARLVGVGGQPRLVVRSRAAPGSLRAPASRTRRASPPRRLRSPPLDPRVVGHGVQHAGRLRGLERQIEARAPGADAAGACRRSGSAHPSPGRSPASTARRSSGSTSPSRPSRAAPPPTHTPVASPAPV